MRDIMNLYHRWIQTKLTDDDLLPELTSIASNEKEIHERFYTDLNFGTAGLRGIIGAGTNRMNIYTVKRATQGLAQYIKSSCVTPSVAIAYDSRNKSLLFAQAAAGVFAANGIKTYIYNELMPTPMLSYAVRELGCQAGIVVTASHNPAAYNGYKVYGSDGCQLTSAASDQILEEISRIDIFEDVLSIDFEQALAQDSVSYIRQELIDNYFAQVLASSVQPDACKGTKLKIAYTPLNGAGNKPVRRILEMIGVQDLVIVAEQELPDGNFPTCTYPNPEIREALQVGIDTAKTQGADILIATDPDADRVGIAVLDNGEYHLLSGNEVGVLLLDYICRCRQDAGSMPPNPVMVKSIVTTTMAEAVGKSYGVEVRNVLTGFKYIGEQIALLEQQGQKDRFILGFEESYGYLVGTNVRDKDAVVASMLIAQMAAFYKAQGKTLVEAMNALYAKYGYYYNTVSNTTFSGSDGMKQMAQIMQNLSESNLETLDCAKIIATENLMTGQKRSGGVCTPIDLPKSDVFIVHLDQGVVVIRPSGTEPKLKVYYMVKESTVEKCVLLTKEIAASVEKLLGL